MGAEGAAPPVVAVVVARRPGPWFENCLRSLAEQDYSALSVLVVTEDPALVAPQVALAFPEAHIAAVPVGASYALAANAGVEKVEGAAHVLVCHDDVVLTPSSVRLLLEEAYRSNAGLTCPKALMCEAPARLLSVGLGADHLGVVHSLVERGELDQGQHDAVREVFVAGGGALLVRTDLWRALGGFTSTVHAGPCSGEVVAQELDLSWRAHLAGARVLVAPQAVVRHHEEMEGEAGRARPCDAHRLRAVWSCYGAVVLTAMLAVATLLQLSECGWALAHRRPRRLVLAPLLAVPGSLRPLSSLRRERAHAQSLRCRSDLRLWRLQSRGSARLRSAVRARVEVGHQLALHERRPWSAGWRPMVAGAVVLGAVVVFGTRHLFGAFPVAGSLPATAGAPGEWWSSWWDGRATGSLAAVGASPALAWMFLLSLAGFGSANFATHVAVLAPLFVGPLGAYACASRLAGRRAGALAGVLYTSVGVGYNAVATGDWAVLVAFAAAPWIVGAVMADGPPSALGAEVRRAVRPGVGLAVAFAFVPAVGLLTVAGGAACAGAVWLVRGGRLAFASLVRAATMLACALVGCLPWSFGVAHTWSAWVGAAGSGNAASAGEGNSFLSLLSFHDGPHGGGPLGLALVVAALCALTIVRGQQFARAAQLCAVAVVMLVLALVGARGWAPLPDEGVMLCFAAAALCSVVATGAATVVGEIGSYRLGWRHLAPGLGVIAVVLAPLPLLSWAVSGSWGLPAAGAESAYPFPAGDAQGDYRVLWAGTDRSELPVPAQGALDAPGLPAPLALSATVDGAAGPLPAEWPGAAGPQLSYAAGTMALAVSDRTTQLGHMLALLGARYVVVPTGTPAEAALVAALRRQVDMSDVGLSPSYAVFGNDAWVPLLGVTGQRTAQAMRALAATPARAGTPGQPFAIGRAVRAEELNVGDAQPLRGAAGEARSSLLVRSPVWLYGAYGRSLQVLVDGHQLVAQPAGIDGSLWGPLPVGRDTISVSAATSGGAPWQALIEVLAFAFLVSSRQVLRTVRRPGKASHTPSSVASLHLAEQPLLEAGS